MAFKQHQVREVLADAPSTLVGGYWLGMRTPPRPEEMSTSTLETLEGCVDDEYELLVRWAHESVRLFDRRARCVETTAWAELGVQECRDVDTELRELDSLHVRQRAWEAGGLVLGPRRDWDSSHLRARLHTAERSEKVRRESGRELLRYLLVPAHGPGGAFLDDVLDQLSAQEALVVFEHPGPAWLRRWMRTSDGSHLLRIPLVAVGSIDHSDAISLEGLDEAVIETVITLHGDSEFPGLAHALEAALALA